MKGKTVLKVASLIEEDHAHRVIIKRAYTAGRFLDPIPPDFKCPDFRIKNGVMRVYKTGKREPIVDGASCAPDKVGSVDCANGYIVHDLLYHYMEQLAHAWDWDVDKVRELADVCLGNAIEQQGGFLANIVGRFYYSAVRVFGGIYHSLRRLFVIGFALGLLAGVGGCSGCQAPHRFDVVDDAPYEVVPADSN